MFTDCIQYAYENRLEVLANIISLGAYYMPIEANLVPFDFIAKG